jgi:polyisoprenyl-teichoic acid--peptidoglycan teichoic acid transferase
MRAISAAPYLTLFLVVLMIPTAACGSYFSYTQSRTRVTELNQVTPLEETDLQKAVLLVVESGLGIDLVEDEAIDEDANTASVIIAPPTEEAAGQAEGIPFAVEITGTPGPDTNADTNDGTGEALEVAEQTAPELDSIEIDPRRTTILLMGIDQREGETGEFRTDTMILLSLDPVGKTGAMLSIPRDLWVTIPGTNSQERINTANFVGGNLNFPGGGPALAMLTVEKVIGVPIDHYVLVNFDAFTTFIETIGDIEICPTERIQDDKYPDGSYGTLSITIEAGCQQMNAEKLLQYARTRATPGGDFDRAQRQQEVILAVRQKITSTGGAAALLGDALTIWESVSNNVKTDLTLDELIGLALAASEVNDVRSGTISTGEVLPGTAPDGAEILIPIQTDIFALVADLFRPPNRPAAAANETFVLDPENIPLAVREEAPLIVLLNGTTIQGRARSLADYILSYNIDVASMTNAPNTDHVETTIVYYGDHDDSAEYLAHILATINGNNVPSVQQGEGTDARGDILVIIGTDLAVPQTAEAP